MKNSVGIYLDLCVSRHSPEENPLFSSPSSSCVDPSQYNYDVFISFRGDDTRLNFTSHLYKALCQNQIRPYIDEDRLEKGDDVSRALPKAIEESAISIVIFSTNYASSTWCLDELVHILKCKKEKSQIVLPIFHGIDPSDIRKQKKSYADAFVEHELRFNNTIDKVQEWRQALIEASGLSGWDSRGKYEADIVEEVVNNVKEKLKYIRSNDRSEVLLKCLKPKLQLANMVLNDVEEKQLTSQVVNKDENIHISIEISKNGRDRYQNQSSNNGNDGGGSNVGEYEYNSPSPLPLSPFTREEQFTHATQYGPYSSIFAVVIDLLGKALEIKRHGQQTRMSQSDEESLAMTYSSTSINTEYRSYDDSQNRPIFNTPYQSSYGAYNNFDYPLPQMPYEISMHGNEQCPPTWVNPNYPIYELSVRRNQSIYNWHMNNYRQNYPITVSWQNYCSNQNEVMPFIFEPLWNSF